MLVPFPFSSGIMVPTHIHIFSSHSRSPVNFKSFSTFMNNFTEIDNQHQLHDVALQSGSLRSTMMFNNDACSYSEAKHTSHSVPIRNLSCCLLFDDSAVNVVWKSWSSRIESSLRIYTVYINSNNISYKNFKTI